MNLTTKISHRGRKRERTRHGMVFGTRIELKNMPKWRRKKKRAL